MEKIYRTACKRLDILVDINGTINHVYFHPTYVKVGVFGGEYVSSSKEEQDAIEANNQFSKVAEEGLFWLHGIINDKEEELEEENAKSVEAPKKRTTRKTKE